MTRIPAISFLAFTIVAFIGPMLVNAQTFTYQGELIQNGNPANGAFDFVFSLRDGPTFLIGVQVGDPIVMDDVAVTNGRFTVELDFPVELFDNSDRWLRAVVNGTSLNPYQKITRTPYAMQTRGINVNAFEDVGMGTTLPESLLHLKKQTTSANFVERLLVVDSHDDPNMFNLQAGSGAGILFKVPYQSDSRVGAAIDAVRATAGETNSATDMAFSVSENNQVLDEALRISSTGEVNVHGRMGLGGVAPTFGQLNIGDSGDGAVFGIAADWNNNTFPAIRATNLGSGGVLWADGASDVEPEGGGVIVVGNESGANIGIDRNEIMARNNGQPSALLLNNDGGTVSMGAHQIKPPLAYGKISLQGNIVSASSNVTGVTKTEIGGFWRYVVSFDVPLLNSDITMITAAAPGFLHDVFANSGGDLEVRFDDIESSFSFVIYRH